MFIHDPLFSDKYFAKIPPEGTSFLLLENSTTDAIQTSDNDMESGALKSNPAKTVFDNPILPNAEELASSDNLKNFLRSDRGQVLLAFKDSLVKGLSDWALANNIAIPTNCFKTFNDFFNPNNNIGKNVHALYMQGLPYLQAVIRAINSDDISIDLRVAKVKNLLENGITVCADGITDNIQTTYLDLTTTLPRRLMSIRRKLAEATITESLKKILPGTMTVTGVGMETHVVKHFLIKFNKILNLELTSDTYTAGIHGNYHTKNLDAVLGMKLAKNLSAFSIQNAIANSLEIDNELLSIEQNIVQNNADELDALLKKLSNLLDSYGNDELYSRFNIIQYDENYIAIGLKKFAKYAILFSLQNRLIESGFFSEQYLLQQKMPKQSPEEPNVEQTSNQTQASDNEPLLHYYSYNSSDSKFIINNSLFHAYVGHQKNKIKLPLLSYYYQAIVDGDPIKPETLAIPNSDFNSFNDILTLVDVLHQLYEDAKFTEVTQNISIQRKIMQEDVILKVLNDINSNARMDLGLLQIFATYLAPFSTDEELLKQAMHFVYDKLIAKKFSCDFRKIEINNQDIQYFASVISQCSKNEILVMRICIDFDAKHICKLLEDFANENTLISNSDAIIYPLSAFNTILEDFFGERMPESILDKMHAAFTPMLEAYKSDERNAYLIMGTFGILRKSMSFHVVKYLIDNFQPDALKMIFRQVFCNTAGAQNIEVMFKDDHQMICFLLEKMCSMDDTLLKQSIYLNVSNYTLQRLFFMMTHKDEFPELYKYFNTLKDRFSPKPDTAITLENILAFAKGISQQDRIPFIHLAIRLLFNQQASINSRTAENDIEHFLKNCNDLIKFANELPESVISDLNARDLIVTYFILITRFKSTSDQATKDEIMKVANKLFPNITNEDGFLNINEYIHQLSLNYRIIHFRGATLLVVLETFFKENLSKDHAQELMDLVYDKLVDIDPQLDHKFVLNEFDKNSNIRRILLHKYMSVFSNENNVRYLQSYFTLANLISELSATYAIDWIDKNKKIIKLACNTETKLAKFLAETAKKVKKAKDDSKKECGKDTKKFKDKANELDAWYDALASELNDNFQQQSTKGTKKGKSKKGKEETKDKSGKKEVKDKSGKEEIPDGCYTTSHDTFFKRKPDDDNNPKDRNVRPKINIR